MLPLPALKNDLKQLLTEGLSQVIKRLGELLQPESTDKYNDFIQLRGRFNTLIKAEVDGIISFSEKNTAYNAISNGFLLFIDGLREEHLLPNLGLAAAPKSNQGELLYHIPDQMQVGHEHKCAVRVAYLKQVIRDNWESRPGDVERGIRVAEVMSVELLNLSEDAPFAIRTLSESVQFLDADDFTEWLFYVKPQRSGQYPLLLRIAVFEMRNGREVKKDVVIEEQVVVGADPVTEAPETFKAAAAAPLQFVTPEPVDSPLSGRGPAIGSPAPAPNYGTPPMPAPAPSYEAPQMPAPEESVVLAEPAPSRSSGGRRTLVAVLAFLVLGSSVTWAATPAETRDWLVTAYWEKTEEAYTAFLEKHPDASPERRETALYRRVELNPSLTNLRAYQQYTGQYRNETRYQRVNERLNALETKDFERAKVRANREAVQEFTRDYPDSRLLPQLKQAVEERADTRREALPVLEEAYLRRMETEPSAQNFAEYRRDFPEVRLLNQFAAAAAKKPEVLQKMQPALDSVIVQKFRAAQQPSDVEAVLPALQAAGSASAVEEVEKSVSKKPALRKQVETPLRQLRERKKN